MKTILLAIAVLGALGALFGAVLAAAAKLFHVDTDPRAEAVRECLAGANCGGCGYPGCDGYAAAVVKGEAPCNCCVAGGPEAAAKIAEIMGMANEAAEKKVAFVSCSGGCGVAKKAFSYTGPQDCRAAMLFGGRGDKACPFACIGLGNCAKACKFDAMHLVDGLARVDRAACVGCGACVEACPKKLVKLLPESQRIQPACSSEEKGGQVMKVCSAGCIGCMKCQRECPSGAITVENNLARIDGEKCTNCGHCAEVCPRGIIRKL